MYYFIVYMINYFKFKIFLTSQSFISGNANIGAEAEIALLERQN